MVKPRLLHQIPSELSALHHIPSELSAFQKKKRERERKRERGYDDENESYKVENDEWCLRVTSHLKLLRFYGCQNKLLLKKASLNMLLLSFLFFFFFSWVVFLGRQTLPDCWTTINSSVAEDFCNNPRDQQQERGQKKVMMGGVGWGGECITVYIHVKLL